MPRFLSPLGRRTSPQWERRESELVVSVVEEATEQVLPPKKQEPRVLVLVRKWGRYEIGHLWLPVGKFRDQQRAVNWLRSQAEHHGVPKRLLNEIRLKAPNLVSEIEDLCHHLRVEKEEIHLLLHHIH